VISLAEAQARDAADPLASLRDRFALPEGVIYLDGNSLGVLPADVPSRIAHVIGHEWGARLVRSWNEAGWMAAPLRIGADIARVIGVAADEVVVADSTSVNLFKLIVAACELAPARRTILTEAGNFPTDLHVARRAAEVTGRTLHIVETAAIEDAIGDDTALVVLAHVHYRSGHRHDIAVLERIAQARGARILWDLSHAAGAIPLALAANGAMLAVGCGYKFLNGGPGAPAYLFVAKALQPRMVSPIAGWLGHAAPFAFGDDYAPAPGIARFQAGAPPMISLLALESGVAIAAEVDMAAVWAKSCALFDLFAALAAERCPALTLASPRDPDRRGSHIAFRHPHAHEIIQALIEHGVIGDFRAPDIARFGLTPLYLSHVDIWRAAEIIAGVLDAGTWRDPRFAIRAAVT
jgi:kynureninase